MNTYLAAAAGQKETAVFLDSSLGGTVPNSKQSFLAPSSSANGVNFGNFQLATISGTKFNDIGGSGTLQPGDPGLAGVTVFLDLNNDDTLDRGDPSTTTDGNGNYRFSNLRAGTYVVREISPTGWVQTTPNPMAITITSGSGVTGVDFGNFELGSISGEKFNDLNGDGIQEAGEPGLAGVTLVLSPGNTTTTSDATGDFSFTNLGPGTYTVREVEPSGWLQTTSNPASVVMTSGSDITDLLFGNMLKVAPTSPASTAILVISASEEVVSTGSVLAASGNAVSIGAISKTQLFGSNLGGMGTSADPTDPPASDGIVEVFNAVTGALKFTIEPYPGFGGEVRVAAGDVNGDGVPDIITGPGPGGGPDIHVYDGTTGFLIRQFFAFDSNFMGGVFVAAGDVNGDGYADIIVGADAGGGPNVAVFSGKDGSVLANLMAYDPNFSGGVRVAAGDLYANGHAEVITGAGPGGGPQVKVFDVMTGQVLQSFFAFDPSFTAGVYVGAGDTSGAGKMNIIVGAGANGGPSVAVFNGTNATVIQRFSAFNPEFMGGVRVTSVYPNGNSTASVFSVAGPGAGAGSEFNGFDSAAIDTFFASDTNANEIFYAAGSQ